MAGAPALPPPPPRCANAVDEGEYEEIAMAVVTRLAVKIRIRFPEFTDVLPGRRHRLSAERIL